MQGEVLIQALRADLALAAENVHTTTCEGCGAPILSHEDACHHAEVVGCWPYVTGDRAPGPCWRYRTEAGMDRAWPECALLARAEAGPPMPENDAHTSEPTFTVVFRGDVRKIAGNPFHLRTEFGEPIAIAVGDAIAELDEAREKLEAADAP